MYVLYGFRIRRVFFIRVSRDFIRAISEVSSRFWGVSVGFGGAGVWES